MFPVEKPCECRQLKWIMKHCWKPQNKSCPSNATDLFSISTCTDLMNLFTKFKMHTCAVWGYPQHSQCSYGSLSAWDHAFIHSFRQTKNRFVTNSSFIQSPPYNVIWWCLNYSSNPLTLKMNATNILTFT